MDKIKKSDIVVRKSHGKDIEFIVKNILNTKNGKIAILRGLIKRVEADSDLEDLELVEKSTVKKILNDFDNRLEERIQEKLKNEYKMNIWTKENRTKGIMTTGKILHLDGDRKYSEKSYRYYKKLGLDAVVKNISEYKQPKVVYNLLKIYNPDILVITGHDRYD